MHVVQSTGVSVVSRGASQFELGSPQTITMRGLSDSPMWIESVWVDDDGTVFGWYHNEHFVCDGKLSMPRIGAAISHDGGEHYENLGIVLDASGEPNCESGNGFFAGGHGDFTVLLDSSRQHFYFYFSNYGNEEWTQGLTIARLAFGDRRNPVGRVWKFDGEHWIQPGLGGQVTPILPATSAWTGQTPDAFWGPSLHWNSYLGLYVMLLTKTCCESGWPTAGTYISVNADLGDPYGWTPPVKILDAPEAQWYPQVLGMEHGMTDREAGRNSRLYIGGESRWEIVFTRADELQPEQPVVVCAP